ncbi:MAG: DNA primase [Sphingomonadales bacterium]
MRFSPEFLDEIRARVALADIIGQKVRLQKKGREHLGLCPFHNEKTPSFTVSEEKGFYHCFGCGAHGDAIRFLTEASGLSFLEAVERLAGQAGLELPRQTADDRKQAKKRDSLYEIMDVAARWFTAQLGTAGGAGARSYLEGRGLDRETLARFALGFAPAGRKRLKEAMRARGFPKKKLIEAGLLIHPEGGKSTYDRFRNRIIFPILDAKGRVIAFGGRALDDAKAKYLNSPDTPLFHKGHNLYNLANARRAAFETSEIIVVEGYMDVIALARYGFDNSVAPLGTALTEDQMKLLWRMVPEPILCFDGDDAGIRAAGRAVERALPLLEPGRSLRFAPLAEGEDPDTFLEKEGGDNFRRLLDASSNLADMLWRMLTSGVDLSTPERRAGLEKKVFVRLAEISDEKVRRFYQSEFGSRLNNLVRAGKRGPVGGRRHWGQPRRRVAEGSGLSSTRLGRERGSAPVTIWMEELLLLTVLNHPELLVAHLEDLADMEIRAVDLSRLRDEVLGFAGQAANLEREALKTHLVSQGLESIYDRLTGNPAQRINWSALPDANVKDAEASWLQTLKRHRRVSGLEREYKALQEELAADLSSEGFERLKAIQKELIAESAREADLEGYGLASDRKMTY